MGREGRPSPRWPLPSGLDVEACISLLEPADALGLLTASGTPVQPVLRRRSRARVRDPVHLAARAGALPPTDRGCAGDRTVQATSPATSVWPTTSYLPARSRMPSARPRRCSVPGTEPSRGPRSTRRSSTSRRPRASAATRDSSTSSSLPCRKSWSPSSACSPATWATLGTRRRPSWKRAEAVARTLGRERAAADFLFTHWAGHSQAIKLDRSVDLAAATAHRRREVGRPRDPGIRTPRLGHPPVGRGQHR